MSLPTHQHQQCPQSYVHHSMKLLSFALSLLLSSVLLLCAALVLHSFHPILHNVFQIEGESTCMKLMERNWKRLNLLSSLQIMIFFFKLSTDSNHNEHSPSHYHPLVYWNVYLVMSCHAMSCHVVMK